MSGNYGHALSIASYREDYAQISLLLVKILGILGNKSKRGCAVGEVRPTEPMPDSNTVARVCSNYSPSAEALCLVGLGEQKLRA